MGKYLDIIAREQPTCDISDISDKTPPAGCVDSAPDNRPHTFGRLSRFCRIYTALEARCPDRVPVDRWQLPLRTAAPSWPNGANRLERLGWTSADLFGLHRPPERPHPSYRRLSRYDETGLIWLLQGRRVTALTEATAAIQGKTARGVPTNSVTVYRRFNKPALGPKGDDVLDIDPEWRRRTITAPSSAWGRQ